MPEGKDVDIIKQTDRNTGLFSQVLGRVELSKILDHIYVFVDL